MNRHGQSITWGTLTAPRLFTGKTKRYSYNPAVTKQFHTDEGGDKFAYTPHSLKAEIDFEAMVTADSSDFLDLSTGAAIVIAGVDGGQILASRATETWRLGQAKTASVQATHYPDMPASDGGAAGTTLSAFTPDQSASQIVRPGGRLIYSTIGLTHAAGVVHGLTLDQILEISPDDDSPDGKILGATDHGYERNIRLELLAKGDLPAIDSVLTIGGAPAHANDYRISDAQLSFEDQRGKMYVIQAVWISAFTTV